MQQREFSLDLSAYLNEENATAMPPWSVVALGKLAGYIAKIDLESVANGFGGCSWIHNPTFAVLVRRAAGKDLARVYVGGDATDPPNRLDITPVTGVLDAEVLPPTPAARRLVSISPHGLQIVHNKSGLWSPDTPRFEYIEGDPSTLAVGGIPTFSAAMSYARDMANLWPER